MGIATVINLSMIDLSMEKFKVNENKNLGLYVRLGKRLVCIEYVFTKLKMVKTWKIWGKWVFERKTLI